MCVVLGDTLTTPMSSGGYLVGILLQLVTLICQCVLAHSHYICNLCEDSLPYTVTTGADIPLIALIAICKFYCACAVCT